MYFPIENGDFPACHVSLLEGKLTDYHLHLRLGRLLSSLFKIPITFGPVLSKSPFKALQSLRALSEAPGESISFSPQIKKISSKIFKFSSWDPQPLCQSKGNSLSKENGFAWFCRHDHQGKKSFATVIITTITTVDGSKILHNHLGCIPKPCK